MTRKARARRMIVSAIETVIGAAMVLGVIAAVCLAASLVLNLMGVA